MKALTATEKSALFEEVMSGKMTLEQVREKIKPAGVKPLPTAEQVEALITGIPKLSVWSAVANGKWGASLNISVDGIKKSSYGKSKGQFALRLGTVQDGTYSPVEFGVQLMEARDWATQVAESLQELLERMAEPKAE